MPRAASDSCPTTSTATWPSAPRCTPCLAWSSSAIGGPGPWWAKRSLALFAPLTALGLLAAGRRFFSPAAGILAAVVYISIPLIANISTVGFIEGAAAFYLFATLYALLLVQGDREAGILAWLLPGYLAGASVACKYPGLLFVVAPLGAWLLWLSLARRDENGRWKPGWLAPVVFGVAVGLGCGLWLAKNWVLAGNPLYPLLFGLFGGETLTAEKVQMWKEVHKPAGFTLSALLADTRRVLLSSDWLSPILIPLAALAFFHRRRRLVVGLAVYFVFIVAAWWCLALRIDRYWAPALPILALLAGAGATWCRARLWQYSPGRFAGIRLAGQLHHRCHIAMHLPAAVCALRNPADDAGPGQSLAPLSERPRRRDRADGRRGPGFRS